MKRRARRVGRLLFVAAVVVAACASCTAENPNAAADSGAIVDGHQRDAARSDARADGNPLRDDTGRPSRDGAKRDLPAPTPDAARPDAPIADAPTPDAARPDSAPPDSATPDAALPDAPPPDTFSPDTSVDSCVPETDSAFCTRLAKQCGVVTALDNCGVTRTVSSCGGCPSPVNGGPFCYKNVCQVVCNAGYYRCSTGCCGWTVETVATGGSWIEDASLAFDSSGKPHIVYWDMASQQLRHAQRSGSGTQWTSAQILSLTLSVSTQTDLERDANGVLHLAGRGQYLTYKSGAWSQPERFTGSTSIAAYGPKLLLGAGGDVHVAYLANKSSSPIEYATRSSNGWTIETVQSNVGGHFNDELAARWAPNGQPVVFYRSSSAYRFATRSPQGVWSTDVVASTGRYYATVSMQRQSAGGYTLIYGTSYATLHHADGAPGSWTTGTLVSGWGLLAQAPPDDMRLVYVNYISLSKPTPLRVSTRASDGSWGGDVVAASVPDGSSVNDARVDSAGHLWFVLGGYRSLKVYRQ